MKTKRFTILLIILLCLLVPAGNLSAQVWSVIGGGGHAENGSYALDGTIGQPLVGTAGDAPYEVCSGFWCGAGSGYCLICRLSCDKFANGRLSQIIQI